MIFARHYTLFFLIVFCFYASPSFLLAAGSIPLYGMYEETINYKTVTGNSHSFTAPFYGVELNATFTSPSGKRITWFGFYDGDGKGGQTGDIWKIRFMPDEVGKWTYTWQFSSQGVSGSGNFTATTTGAKPGPLKQDKNIPQWLITADEKKYVFLNMNHTGDFSAHTNPNRAITDTKNNRYDALMIPGPAHPHWDGQTKNSSNPYQFMDTNSFTPRLQGWHFAENGLYKEAYDNNIYIYEFLGFYAGNKFYLLHQKSTSFQNKVLKYWLARTAANYIFLYNIGFELAEYVSVPSWPEERARYIKSLDPFNHLITGHQKGGRWSYGSGSSAMGFSALQTNEDFHKMGLRVWNSPSKSHPHCNECIWSGFPQYQAPGTESSHRRDLWDGITAGMSYAFIPWMGDKTGTSSFKHANTFLKSGVKWWKMSPHDEIVISDNAYALANLGKEYIVYSNSGSKIELKLPNGTYMQQWFNPASGSFTEKKSLVSADGKVELNKPNTKDWVLHLEFSSSNDKDTIPPSSPTNLNVN